MTQDRMASRPTGTVAFSISLANVGTSIYNIIYIEYNNMHQGVVMDLPDNPACAFYELMLMIFVF